MSTTAHISHIEVTDLSTIKELQQLFPSEDGNSMSRQRVLEQISRILTEIDRLKDPSRLTLGEMPEYRADHYNLVSATSQLPKHGLSLESTVDHLLELVKGHRYINRRYVANATPLPNLASVLGHLIMVLLNGNNIWDVEGQAGAYAEVKVTSMLSKLVGHDAEQSGGYTTWGGQGAVFHALRLAIARQFPQANKEGVPGNLYTFCSETAHFSLYKSMEAAGLGVNQMVRVRTNKDHSMDLDDLRHKMEQVILNGGIPVFVLATMGTTDSFGIDDIRKIKTITTELEQKYDLYPVYIHADSAMGGMYAFFNDYDYEQNPLGFEPQVKVGLEAIFRRIRHMYLADSLVFDFHKLGQTPYISSLFLVKNKQDFRYVDLDPEETPYVGNRGYGSYHTSYTLECSRSGSALAIYATLLAFGEEGMQQLLANYIRVNAAFRQQLVDTFEDVAVTNELTPVTTFRFYPDKSLREKEVEGRLTASEIEWINKWNESFAEYIGRYRDNIYFGNTKKQCLLKAVDTSERLPVYAHKFFCISPYSTVDEVANYVSFLKQHMHNWAKAPVVT